MVRVRGRPGLVRAATTVALATAQPMPTLMARWTGHGKTEIEQATATEGPVTPAGWAFVIWAPLFAGSLAYAARDLRAQIEASIVRAAVALPLAVNPVVTVVDKAVTGVASRDGGEASLTSDAEQWAVVP